MIGRRRSTRRGGPAPTRPAPGAVGRVPISDVRRANGSRNASRPASRHERWAPARDALWALLDAHVAPGARVAVVGAGNADDLPLSRLADRAGSVVLLDLDRRAPAAARAREPRAIRRAIEVRAHDVTGGAADRIVAAARERSEPTRATAPADPLPGAPYDVVVADLVYSQLLFPAMRDAGIPPADRRAALDRDGPGLTRSVAARLHASAPGGVVVHVHDVLCWGTAEQPVTLDEILAAADRGEPAAAAALVARGLGPAEADPLPALAALGITARETRLWRWPFVDGVDYLVRATVAGDPAAA